MSPNPLKMFITMVFVSLIIFTATGSLLASDSIQYLPSTKPDLRSKTEWFAFSLGIGSYLGAMNFGLITLRKPNVFWELFHFRSTAFWTKGHFEIGTTGGVSLQMPSCFEMRTGLGLVKSFYTDDKQNWTGYGVTPQISFLRRKSHRIAWEMTFSLHIPISGEQGTESGYEYLLTRDGPIPTPLIFTVCGGFRL